VCPRRKAPLASRKQLISFIDLRSQSYSVYLLLRQNTGKGRMAPKVRETDCACAPCDYISLLTIIQCLQCLGIQVPAPKAVCQATECEHMPLSQQGIKAATYVTRIPQLATPRDAILSLPGGHVFSDSALRSGPKNLLERQKSKYQKMHSPDRSIKPR